MRRHKALRCLFVLVFLCGVLAFSVAAQDSYGKESMLKGFRGEFMAQFDEGVKKVMQLADAMPEDKYTWRPQEDVRSVSEVFMHIAGANGFFGPFIGLKMEHGMDFAAAMKLEKETTAKGDVKKHLEKSFESVRELVRNMKDEYLDKEVTIEMIGMTTSYRGILLLLHGHLSEHLGQSIAYARMNNVAPPWSQRASGSD